MPHSHLYEVKNDKQILCFVPSGHNLNGEFVDLPGHIGESCWYEAQKRLTSLYCTQKPFDLKEFIEANTQGDLPAAVRLQSYIDITTIAQKLEKAAIFMLLANFIVVEEKLAAEALDFNNADFIKKCSNNFQIGQRSTITQILDIPANQSELKEYCQLLQHLLAHGTNKNKVQIINTFYQVMTDIALDKAITSTMIGFLVNNSITDLEHKQACQIAALNMLFAKANGLQEIQVPLNDITAFKKQIIKTLDECGPFMATCFLGQDYYKEPPKFLEKLGSVDLLYFTKSSYVKLPDLHCVNVIGMSGDRVIFLDPKCDSNVNGPRQAFTISLASFMEKINLGDNKNTATFWAVNKNRIDITPEMLQALKNTPKFKA